MTIRTEDRASATAPNSAPQHLLGLFVRSGGDIPADHRPDRCDLREPRCADQLLAGGEGPVVGEHLHHLRHHRPLDAEMGVLDRGRRPIPQHVPLADVQAAGEADPAVDHQDLAMGAQVEERHPPRHQREQETRRRDPAPAQLADNRLQGIEGADPVDDDPNLDAATHRALQGIEEPEADGVLVEDEAAERDAAPGPFDGRDHLGIGDIAIDQRGHRIAPDQRALGEALDHVGEHGQVFRLRRQHRMRGAGSPAVRADPHRAQAPRPPPDPIDPQHHIEDRAEDRRQPDQADPGHRGTLVGFAQQHMRRHAHGQQNDHDSEQDGKRFHGRPMTSGFGKRERRRPDIRALRRNGQCGTSRSGGNRTMQGLCPHPSGL